jgi:RNA polymerase sigma-70 factor (ECF subfamily)
MSEADEERFCSLYESARPRIIAYALRRSTSPEDAADIVAETFEVAWRRLDDVPAGPDSLLSLYVTARHVLANSGRKTRRRDEIATRLAYELRAAHVDGDPLGEEGLLALSCLHSLPEDDRELLMLTGWDGLSGAEAGRVLGCSATAARIRLHRARLRLNEAMAQIAGPEKHARPIGRTSGGETDHRPAPEEVVEQ